MANKIIREETLVNIADAIRSKTGSEERISPVDMASSIEAMDIATPMTPVVISGNTEYAFSGKLGSIYIDNFGDTITTNYMTNADHMFNRNTCKHIPFELNFSGNYKVSCSYFFAYSELEDFPKINNLTPSEMKYMFGYSTIKKIPSSLNKDIDWSYMHNYIYANMSCMFYECKHLREIDEGFLSNLKGIQGSAIYTPYYSSFYNCSNLDKVKNLGITTSSTTSSYFNNTFLGCSSLSEFTFEVNEDGTPKTANWKSQTISLGGSETSLYSRDKTRFTTYGRDASGEVFDDESYKLNKNNPDYFTTLPEYARYNHDSAVATINSLPDTSAYLASVGGTNTIKYGWADKLGSKTDGGAIGNLTAEEIAVAAAKGWTITFA